MEVLYGSRNQIIQNPSGVGLGNFDGLHVGHMALINTVINESKLNGLNSVLYTFTKHPESILRKKLFTPLLTTVSKKVELLNEMPLNYLYFDEFDEKFSRIAPEEFVKKVLIKKLNIKLAIAGFDYKFGYKGQGDVDFLKELGKKYNFKVVIIPPVKIGKEIASSTAIRRYVSEGDMDTVFKLLGRHYSLTGRVQRGRGIGNTIGFPTANLHPENYLIFPHNGVYITRTYVDGTIYNSITNIGLNPTFEELTTGISVETHLLNFNQNIYDKTIEVYFLAKIRGEKKFGSKDELVAQIKKDIIKTREFFNINID